MIVKNINDIEIGYTQAFRYPPLAFGSYSSSRIQDLCEKGVIDSDVVEVAEYLFKVKCAPFEYIQHDLKDIDSRKMARKMDELVRMRLLNKFILVSNNEPFTDEGLVFYTIDYGMILVLRTLIESENLENWKAPDLYMTGIKVKKALMLINFKNMLGPVDYYKTYELYSTYGARMRTRFVFSKDKHPYLVEFVCRDDLLENSETGISEKLLHYEQLLGTDGWTHQGFEEVPTLLIVTDSVKARDDIKNRIEGVNIPKVQYMVMEPKEK